MLDKLREFRNFALTKRYVGPLAILVVLVIVLAIIVPENNFLRMGNIRNLLSFGPEFGIIVLGAGMLMIAGEFDLSVGSVLAFSAMIFTFLYNGGVHPFPALIITMGVGAGIGFINGIITVKARILSFVATLGAMWAWRGLTLLITGGDQIPIDPSLYPGFTIAMTGELFGFFPMQAVWFIILAFVLSFVLHRHKYGNWVYSTGSNSQAARSMCINTGMVRITSFMIVSTLVGFAAVMQLIRVSSFSSRVGTEWELKVIAAAVVGGTSLLGGRGSMPGVFMGALVIIIIENALNVGRLPYEWTYTVYGLIIMLSALLDLYIEKRKLKFT